MKAATILVVEDNPITRKMMRFALESEGIRVLEAGEGRAALDLARTQPPDLVLQDYVLPDMDGLQLVEGLRALPRTANTPIIVITGMVSQLDELRRHGLPNTTFLPKPMEPSRLLEVVRSQLAAQSSVTTGGARRVLVVDDEPLNLKLAAMRLRDAGFQVETAVGGEQALERARSQVPDAILSDVLMPGIDGFLLCDAVRRDPELAQVPVVLLSSAYVDDADQALAREMGANALLLRTPDFASAISALEDALRSGAAAPAPTKGPQREGRHKERLQIQLERQLERNDALVRQGAIQAAALSVVRGLAEAMAKPRDLASVLGDVLVHCLDATGLSTGLLYLVAPDGTLQLRAQAGLPAEARAAAAACFGHAQALRRALEGTEPLAFSAAAGSEGDPELRALTEKLGRTSVLLIPFVVADERVGLLLLAADAQDFSERPWIGFANTLARQFGQTIAVGQSLFRGAASEARYRTLMEHANDAILLVDNGGIVEANHQAEVLLGRNRSAMVGRRFDEFVAPSHRSAAVLFAGDTTRTEDQLLRRADGTTVSVDVSASPVRIGEETIVLLIIRDISERRRLEAQLRQAQKMEAVGRLAGGVAHDFNNLLGVISGYSELLVKGAGLEPTAQRRVLEIQKAAQRAAALTRQLLAFSRKQVLETKVLSLNELVTGLAGMLHRLIGEDVRLVTKLSPDLGQVRADGGQIEQVIVNLVVNARDAMPRGGELIIETANSSFDESDSRQHADVAPGPYVMIVVSDTGEGMDAETQSHIFEPFFTTKGEGKGTGLGLATVFGIVKQSGGHISVYSEPQRGSTFRVYLPRTDEAAHPDPDAPAPPAANVVGHETIALVEDAEALRLMIREILEGSGYVVFEYAGPDEAREALGRQKKVDLLLTDVVMPRSSGPELARALRQAHPDIKVLFMSGYTDQAVGDHGVLVAEGRFLQKPFTTDGLLEKVRAVLDAR